MKNSLNIYLKVYIYLVIVRHIVKFIQTIIEFPLALSGVLSMPILIWNSILGISIVYVLINILRVKKWALYTFGGIQLVNVLVQSMMFDEGFGALAIVALVLCVLMAALLFLKKDGVSSWSLFFDESNNKEKLFKSNMSFSKTLHKEVLIEEIKTEKMNAICLNEVHNEEIVDLTVALNTLPLKEDGTLDYEKMTPVQQFAYTAQTESLETALDDLKKDIREVEKSISTINKELSLMSGGNRARLRDILREEQNKLNLLYAIYQKYTSKEIGKLEKTNTQQRETKNTEKKSYLSWLIIVLLGFLLINMLIANL